MRMETAYKYVLECVQSKKIDRQTAIDLIKLLEDGKHRTTDDIAIIGMAARLPSMESIREFQDVIESGVDCITDFPDTRSQDITEYLSFKGKAGENIRFNKSAYLYDIDKFDYKFFKLSPREASLMDPAQRIFLETSWDAIEDAGYGGYKLDGKNAGVYVGFATNIRDMYAKLIEEADPSGLSISILGNLSAVISGRLSYLLNLRGASMVVDTACSSSLVAIDLACQALRNKTCDYAIAGGININTVPVEKDDMKTGIESSDGVSRTFDNHSDGSGIGEGVGAIVLKPLREALQDKDHIYAVIKGSATNQDGRSAGLSAPNPQAQTEVILKAWENAGINPESISYIETHGTGTNLGDPIEIQGIQAAFRKHTDKKQFCAVSSVKTNIGHLSEAAGIVSVMKAILALQTKQIPPSIHFNLPNRSIAFEDSPVYVNTKLRAWESGDQPRRCGISAFGISGTNSHIVLEEAPAAVHPPLEGQVPWLFTLSAKTKEILQTLAAEYVDFLKHNKQISMDDICYTANSGRGHYAYRLAIIPDSLEDLQEKLAAARLDELDSAVYYGYRRNVDSKKEALEPDDLPERERERLSAEATAAILNYWSDDVSQVKYLEEICRLYVRGADIDWELLTGDEKPSKIPLPVYPFERSRCWLNVPESIQEQEHSEQGMGNCFYGIRWMAEPLPANKETCLIDHVLVITDKTRSALVNDLISKLKSQGKQVIEVTAGDTFEQINNHCYTIGNTEEHYGMLMSHIGKYKVTHILHMCGLSDLNVDSIADLERSQSRGIHSLLYLTRAILKNDWNSRLHLLLFTSNLHAVTGEESCIRPEFATLAGLGKVVSQEYSHLVCKAIDVDHHTLAEAIAPELEEFTGQYQVAYRQGSRYVEEFGPFDPQQYASSELVIKDTGVYLITGGTGGIGLEMAKYLASHHKANLALISRTGLPERSEWEAIFSDSTDQALIGKLRTLLEIESLGSKIILEKADVSDWNEMKELIERLRAEYGRINGVIHGAGIAGAGYIFNKDIQVFNNVLNPKVTGTWILDQLTQQDELDFFIMQSSGVSLVGEAGQGDYVAGNAFMDAFAAYRRKNNQHALAINWVSWKEAGMSVRYGINVDSIYKALPTEKAIQGMDMVLRRSISNVLIGEINESPEYLSVFAAMPFRVNQELLDYHSHLMKGKQETADHTIVSNGNYDAAMINNGKLIILPKGKQPVRKVQSNHVAIKGKQGENYNATEQDIAKIFGEILGYTEIDIHDSLFELGGDSLLLMRIHKLVDERYPGKVSITDMFEFPSVHKLALHISKEEEVTEEKVPIKDIRQEASDIFERLAQGTMSLEDAINGLEDL